MRKRSISIEFSNSSDYFENCEIGIIEQSKILRKRSSSSSKKLIQMKSEEKDLNDLTNIINNLNQSYKNSDIDGFSKFLVSYLKETQGLKNSNELFLHSHRKNELQRSLTQSSLLQFDIHDAIHYISSSEAEKSNPTSPMNKFISENLEIKDEIIKIMWIGAAKIGKTRIIKHLLEKCAQNEEKKSEEDDYNQTNGMEIKKLHLNLFGKNVVIEFYDTNCTIHNEEVIKIYYNIVHTFFYVVLDSSEESFNFVSEIHPKIHSLRKNNCFYYIFYLKSKDTDISNDLFDNVQKFADLYNMHVISCFENQIDRNSHLIQTIFNNIFIKKTLFLKNKSKKSKNIKQSEIMKFEEQNELSINSTYSISMENNEDPFREKVVSRKYSFNQKIHFNKGV